MMQPPGTAAKQGDARAVSGDRTLTLGVIVAALGYFVDIYDLVLFSIVRVPCLKAIGITDPQALLDKGTLLLNVQMFGMLVGGIAWGVLGDRRGRVSILFGSILLYSIANLLNGFANSFNAFFALRFIAGVGLAGELGAGITLVAETLPATKRGYGAAIVAGFGVLGAVLANKIAEVYDWRAAYLIGGVLGLALLVMRAGALESGLFRRALAAESAAGAVGRGNFLRLFTNPARCWRYLCCIFTGLPLWYMVGILLTLSPELATQLGVEGKVTAGRAITYAYIGIAAGDFISGVLSQIFGTRKRVILAFQLMMIACVAAYFSARGVSAFTFYAICSAMGFAGGYWAVLLLMSAEQFGTNLRATAATTVPNFIRGALPLLSTLFVGLKPSLGLTGSAAATGALCLALALLALTQLAETSGRELDFLEH